MGMRPSIISLRLLPLFAVAAGALFFAGWKVVDRLMPGASPFAMWDLRPGVEFQALNEDMRRQTRSGFICHELVRDVRYCEKRAHRIAGLIRLLVDSSDRVARIQFVPDSATPLMREEGRRIAARWNQVSEPTAESPRPWEPWAGTGRWASADSNWTALIRYGRLGRTPTVVQLTDERAFARIANTREALGPIALVRSKLADSADVRSAPELAATLKRVQAGEGIAAGLASAPASRGATAPPCEPVPLDLGVQSSERRHASLKDEVVTVLRRAITRAYGGAQLVFGKDLQLRDSAGGSERVSIGPGETDEETGITVIAVQFPARVTNAMDRLRDKLPADYCRATAEVLFAQKAPNGDIAEVHRIPIGDDALTTDVTHIELVPSEARDAIQLRVRYTAAYGTEQWAGAVDWEAMVSLTTRRALTRAPLAFRHITEETSMNAPGTLVITRRQPGSVEMATLESHDWGFKTRTVQVPIGADGALEGVQLLRQLIEPNGPRQ